MFQYLGATNVGSVKIYIDEDLKTNRWHGLKVGKHNKRNDYDERILPDNTKLGKGELLGQFNMGSTVVLVFEAPKKFRYITCLHYCYVQYDSHPLSILFQVFYSKWSED